MPHRFSDEPTVCPKLLFLLTLTFFLATLNYSRADGVDDYVKNQMRRQHVVGLSLAVVKEGKVIKARGYGLADLELNVPATKDTVYDIASIGKQFTATAIMMLVEDGKIGLDDRITNYLDYSWAFGAGAEASTVIDMAKWDASLSTEKLLPKKRWKEMWTAVKLNDGATFPYGFGWHVQTDPGDTGRVIWHGGSDPGNLSAVFHWMDDRITVIVFLTAGAEWLPNGQESSADIAMGVSIRYIPRLFDKPIGDTLPQLTARMKADLERLISGNLDGTEISPKWSGRKLPDIKQWALQLSDLGKMKTFVPIWKNEAVRLYVYRAVFLKESVRFGLTLDENGKLSSIDLGIE